MARYSALIIAAFLFFGCSYAERNSYVVACQDASIGTAEQCQCLFDLSKESLTQEQHELFLAISINDKKKAGEIRSRLGMIATTAATVRTAWLAANAESACDVKGLL